MEKITKSMKVLKKARKRKPNNDLKGSTAKRFMASGEKSDQGKEETKVKGLQTWKSDGSILFADFGAKSSDKVAGFDMDSTLIDTKSGALFAKNASDWKWWDETVPNKLKEIHEDGYKIVIFSNQAGVEINRVKPETLKGKFTQLYSSLKIPFQALCATSKDENRKPNTGMWKYFVQNCNNGVIPKKTKSFYCGDAAGRPKTKTKKKDFSDGDRKFALNTGLTFYTPEMYFLGIKERLPPLAFNVKKLKDLEGKSPTGEEEKYAKEEQEMIIFIGSPGAGKSTFWNNFLKDYVRVNNDTLKTKEKCMKVARQALEEGKSCVIDNTNPDAATRSRYTSI